MRTFREGLLARAVGRLTHSREAPTLLHWGPSVLGSDVAVALRHTHAGHGIPRHAFITSHRRLSSAQGGGGSGVPRPFASTSGESGDIRAVLRQVWNRREVTLPEMQRICEYYNTFSPKDFDPRYSSGLLGVIRYSGRFERETLQMIRKSNELLETALKSKTKLLSLRFIAEYIGNLRHVNSSIPEVLKFLSLCLEMMRCAPATATFSPNGVAHMLFGMRGMSSDEEVVRNIYSFLAKKLNESNFPPLDAQNISNILYGMQSCSSDAVEVRQFITALIPKIRSCTSVFLAQHIGNSLYGLNRMSSKCDEVRALLAALIPKIEGCTIPLRGQHIGNALYGLRLMNSDHTEVVDLLHSLCPKVVSSGDSMSIQEISMALYGLQSMKCDSQSMRLLLAHINTQLRRCQDPFSGQGIGISIYGMQLMNSNETVVQDLVEALRWKVEGYKGRLTMQNASNAIYGLKSMSDKAKPVRDLILALTPKIAECKEFDVRCVSNSIYGLQNMDSFSFEVRGLLRVLSQKLEQCDDAMLPQHVGNIMYGLRYMCVSTEEVRRFVSVLSAKIIASDVVLTGQELANGLYGLQSMSSESSEALGLVSAILSKISRDGSVRLSAMEISNAIYGMQGLSGIAPLEKSLIRAILPALDACPSNLDEQGIGIGLYGLQRMSDSTPEVATLVASLRRKITIAVEDAMLSHHQISSALYGLINMSTSNSDVKAILEYLLFNAECILRRLDHSEISGVDLEELQALYRNTRLSCHCAVQWDEDIRSRLKIVGDKLHGIVSQRESSSALKSNVGEQRVYQLLKRALKENHMDESIVTANEFIDHFEADVVVRFPVSNHGTALQLDIEIDGPSHEYPSRKLFCERRDSYLHATSGVIIVRLALHDVADLTKSNIIDRIVYRALRQYGEGNVNVCNLVNQLRHS